MKQFIWIFAVCAVVLAWIPVHAMPLGIRTMIYARANIRQAALESAQDTCTVAFDANGGVGEMAPQAFVVGLGQELPDCTFVRTGYAFGGWSLTRNGGVAYSNGQVVNISSDEGSVVTLYAVWEEIPQAHFDIDENGVLTGVDLNGVKDVGIPDGVTRVGDWVFCDCVGLTSVTIPYGVTSIGDSAFFGCSGLASVTMSDSVTNIEYGAFADCFGLTSVTIPDSVISIGELAFSGCSGLTSVTIPYGVTSVSGDAFSYCSELTSVTIPDSVTSIGDSAFDHCRNLTNVTIPYGVTSIGNYAFDGCVKLTNVVFNGNAPNVGTYAFRGLASSCMVFVRLSSTGWDVVIPGTWNGLRIEYLSDVSDNPIPSITENATPEAVTNAIEAVGFTDVGVKAAIGGSAKKYAAFKMWADNVKGAGSGSAVAGAAAVVANTNAATAFLLGAERLFENLPTIEIAEVVVGEKGTQGTSVTQGIGVQGQGTMSVCVIVKDDEVAVQCAAEKVREMFEATSDLSDWGGESKLLPMVTIDDTSLPSAMRFKVTLGDGTATRAFLRVKVK